MSDEATREQSTTRSPSILPPGPYLVRLDKHKEFVANSGTPGRQIELEVVSGPYTGARIPDVFYITEKARSRMQRLCDALGVSCPENGDPSSEEIVGRVCWVDVAPVTEYDKKAKKAVARNAVSFSGYSPASEEDLASVEDRVEDTPF